MYLLTGVPGRWDQEIPDDLPVSGDVDTLLSVPR